MKGRLRVVIGIAISLLCLYFVLRGIDPIKLWTVYRHANYLYLLPSLAILILVLWVRAYRWRLLMYPDQHLSLSRLFSIVNIGYLFNNIVPAKVGEIVRGYLVGRLIPGGIGQALSTLVVERLLDVLSTVVLLVGLVPFMSLPDWAVKGGILLGAASIGGTAVLLVLARFGEPGLDWIWRFVGRIRWVGDVRVRNAVRNLLLGFRVLTLPKLLPGIIVSSLIIWFGYALFDYVIACAFGLSSLSVVAIVFVLVATAFGMVVPSSPGGVGPYEAGAVLALGLYGVEQSQAFGYAFGLHAFTNVALIILGLWGLRSESVSFGSLRTQVSEGSVVPSAASES